MKQGKAFYHHPIELNPAHAWRTYTGGKLLEQLHGNLNGTDSHFPEEWLFSVVEAVNKGREVVAYEGLSHVVDGDWFLKDLIVEAPEAMLGRSHYKELGASTGMLVKLIDAAERLTIQVHPDKKAARELFDSMYGKTECWHILGGRNMDGERPYIYLGFKPGITRQKWMDFFDRQDIEAMLNCLNRFEVNPGDTVLIKGGVPHAIGQGCFLLEIQEPTDYTIRTERITPAGLVIEDAMCHQGLGFDRMFDCFHYEGVSQAEAKERWFLPSGEEMDIMGNRRRRLVGYEDTPCFRLESYEIYKHTRMKPAEHFSGIYFYQGHGTILYGDEERTIKPGTQYFIPASCEDFELVPKSPMTFFQCFGPKVGN